MTGASQGAQSLNHLLDRLAADTPRAFDGWQVLHLTGPGGPHGPDALQARYDASGIHARAIPFLDEMGLAWGAADLAVSRAGANSVAEAEVNRVPTIFLPYPFHRDEHQRANAQRLADRGAAIVEVDHVDPERNWSGAGASIVRLLGDASARRRLEDALDAVEVEDAAQRLADLIARAAH